MTACMERVERYFNYATSCMAKTIANWRNGEVLISFNCPLLNVAISLNHVNNGGDGNVENLIKSHRSTYTI